MHFEIEPIGIVEASRLDPRDDDWGGEEACIRLEPRYAAESLQGLGAFSHVEVLFVFHRVDPDRVVSGARHPRGNADWPAVGIFAQRGKNRPNRIGSTICRVVRVDGSRLHVAELDAIDGTPVVDIKPVMAEFLPRTALRQPAWSHALMRDYWRRAGAAASSARPTAPIRRRATGAGGRSRSVACAGFVWTVANARDVQAGLAQQIDETLSLLDDSLREAGSGRQALLSVQVLLADIGDRSAFDAKWREWIGPDPAHWPQRAVLGAALAPGLLLEIVATAAATGGGGDAAGG